VPFDPRAVDMGGRAAFDLKGYLHTLYDSRWLIGGITALHHAGGGAVRAGRQAGVRSQPDDPRRGGEPERLEEHPERSVVAVRDQEGGDRRDGAAALAHGGVARGRQPAAVHRRASRKYFPIAGFWFANQNGGALSEPGLFGYGGYVWGGEKAEVSVFEVPESWLGREFTLTALGNGRYRFSGGGQRIVFDGNVGLRYRVPTPDGVIELKVDRMSRQGRRALPAAPHVAAGHDPGDPERPRDHRAGQAVRRDRGQAAGRESRAHPAC
jgi:tyrosine-protein kinase Etk/Wzc